MNSVDRIGGRNAAGADVPGTCLNCEALLSGPYCAECGQRAKINRTLSSFFADFVSGMVNLEGRLWHTLPLLVWRPGELTRRYVDGQRARFVSPVGLYLFTVFLMFAVLGFTGSLANLNFSNSGIGRAVANQQQELDKLQQRRAAAQRAGQDVASLDRKIAATQSDMEQLKAIQNGNLQTDLGSDSSSPRWFKEAIVKAAANPREAVTKIQEAASRFSWLLIPLSVPFLRLLFPFRRRRLYDHTVFVTYSLSFMMFLVIAGGLLVMGGFSAVAAMLVLVPPVHMYRQLRGAYGLRWWDAVFRTFLLVNAASFVLLLWFLAIAAVGLLE